MRREFGPIAIILLVGIAAALKEPRYLQPTSISGILLWVPLLAIVGFGQMMVIVTRGIDVSVGSVAGFSAMTMGLIFKAHPDLSLPIGIGVAILSGLLLGCVNGMLIAWAKVPPIIATLGGLSAYRGLIFMVSKSKPIDSNDLPDALTKLSLNGPITVGHITLTWLLFFALIVAGVMAYVTAYTRFGRNLFAIGGNPNAALLRGVPTRRVLFAVYAITGGLAGFAGFVYASQFGFVNPGTAGRGLELSVIAATVIGGTKVTGGVGSVPGVLLGSLLLGMLNTALAVLGISDDYQPFVYGIIILVALLLDTSFQRWLSTRRVTA